MNFLKAQRPRRKQRALLTLLSVACVLALADPTVPAVAAGPIVKETGQTHHLTFHSDVLGSEQRVLVYTPPQYDGNKRLPVTYVSPGGCAAETDWLENTGLTTADLDNLFVSGKAQPQILVFVSGQVGTNIFANPLADPFPDVLVNDIVPFIDRSFSTIPNSEHRALGGNSCGGVQVLNSVVQYPGAFRSIGLWSTGWFPETRAVVESDPAVRELLSSAQARNGIKYLEYRIGAEDSLAGPHVQATLDLLRSFGIETDTRVEFPGVGHNYEAEVLGLLQGLSAFFQK